MNYSPNYHPIVKPDRIFLVEMDNGTKFKVKISSELELQLVEKIVTELDLIRRAWIDYGLENHPAPDPWYETEGVIHVKTYQQYMRTELMKWLMERYTVTIHPKSGSAEILVILQYRKGEGHD